MGETQEVKLVTRDILSVLRREDVPEEDRVWAATRPGVVEVPMLRRWLGRLVRRALGRVDSPDPRSLAVLEYLDRGEEVPEDVRRDVAAANADDTYAASSAASAVDAANAAACATAFTAAVADAAFAAALAAASACDAYAACSDYACSANAEREQQVADLIELLA